MLIEKVDQNLVKVQFSPNEEDIFIGDLLEIGYTGKKGVLAQVIAVESAGNHNVASAKILYTITEDCEIENWQGNVPGIDFIVSKLPPEDVPGITNTVESDNLLLSRELSGYPDVIVNIDAGNVENLSIIAGDKELVKNSLLATLANGFANNNAPVLLVDFNGSFSDIENALVLKAGKDIKLPLDLGGLETLYNKTLSSVSAEIKAGIENIFSEIEDYLASGEASFIPFTAFIDAVRDENEAESMPELELLINSLAKLHKKGVFADGQKEMARLFREFKGNNFIILDLSGITREWKACFVDFVVKSAEERLNKAFFLLLDADKYLQTSKIDPADASDILINGALKAGIKPVYALAHRSPLMNEFSMRAENLFVLSPLGASDMACLTPYLSRISPSDMLIAGQVTGNIPLYVKLEPGEKRPHTHINTHFEAQAAVSEGIMREAVEEIALEESNYDGYGEVEEDPLEEAAGYAEEGEEVYSQEEDASYSNNEELEEGVSEDEKDEYEYDEKPAKGGSYEPDPSYYVSQRPVNNSNREFSDDDLKDFMDMDDDQPIESEYGEYYSSQGQQEYDEDESLYYASSSEFQDESMLDYAVVREDGEETTYSQPQVDEEDESYYEEEDSTGHYHQPNAEYSVSGQEGDEYAIEEFVEEEERQNEEEYEPESMKEPEVIKPKRELGKMPPPSPRQNLPVYQVPGEKVVSDVDLEEGDTVRHKKYGTGVVKKIIGYSEKRLCSIQFEEVGRRLLDPRLAGLEKVVD